MTGLRAAAVEAMLAARAAQPFASLDDWLRRTTFTAAERRALAAVGALNGLAAHRRAALWQVEAAWSADEDLLQRYAAEDRGPAAPLGPRPPDVVARSASIDRVTFRDARGRRHATHVTGSYAAE